MRCGIVLTLTLVVLVTQVAGQPASLPNWNATRVGLLRLYNDWNGPNWIVADGWRDAAGGADSNPCCYNADSVTDKRDCLAWTGLRCSYDNTTDSQLFTGIFFESNNIRGEMTDNVCGISDWMFLFIVIDAPITGAIPRCITDYPFLNQLYLTGLKLDAGPLPVFLSELENLSVLSVGGSNFEGPIPDEYAVWTPTLTIFDVGGSPNINGTIPDWFADAPLLEIFVVRGTSVGYEIPPWLFQLPSIRVIDLSQALFNGTIPDTFRPDTHISTLDLSFNRLSGELPLSLGAALIASPMNVTLTENLLSGSLDILFMPGTQIVHLDVSANLFSGPLPVHLTNAHNLTVFLARHNAFNGTVPSCFDKLPALTTLDLGQNQLSAFDPDLHLWNSTNLRFLSLRSNRFIDVPELFYLFISSSDDGLASCTWYSALTFVDVSDNPFGAPVTILPSVRDAYQASPSAANAADRPFIYDGLAPQSSADPATTPQFSLAELFTKLIGSNGASSTALLQCVLALDERNRVLHTLVAADLGLTGEIPSLLFSTFPALTHLDMSHNSLSSNLPASSLLYPFYLPFPLSYLDLSYNQLEGRIPLVFGLALESNLRVLALEGNIYLHTANDDSSLPQFLLPDYTSNYENATGHFLCPSITDISEKAIVPIDPTFYDYTLCVCVKGFMGIVNTPTGCRALSSLCSDSTTCVGNVDAGRYDTESADQFFTNAHSLVVQPGYWPAPHPSRATVFARCSLAPRPLLETACNPHFNSNASVTCHIRTDASNNQIFDCGPPDSICTAGATGRFCSVCQDGYFPSSNGCKTCSWLGPYQGWGYTLLSYVGVLISMLAVFLLRSQSVSIQRSKLRRAFHAHPTALGFVQAYWTDAARVSLLALGVTFTMLPYSIPVASIVFLIVSMTFFVLYSLVRRSLPVDLEMQISNSRDNVLRSSAGTVPLIGGEPGSLNGGEDGIAMAEGSMSDLDAYFYDGRARAETAPDDDHRPMGGMFGSVPVSDVRKALAVMQGIFKSYLVWFQTAEALTYGIVHYPDGLLYFVNFNELILASLRLKCRSASFGYENAFNLVMVTPLLAALTLLLAYWAIHGYLRFMLSRDLSAATGAVDSSIRMSVIQTKYRVRVRSARRGVFAAAVVIGYITYFPVTRAYFSLFSCADDPAGSETQFLVAAPSITCYEGWAFFSMLISGTTMYLLYTAAMVMAFIRIRHHYHAGTLTLERVRVKYAILIDSWRPHAARYESVLTTRRILIGFVVAAAPVSSPLTAAGVMTILALSLAVQGWIAPYKTSLVNFLEMANLVTLITIYIMCRTLLKLYVTEPAFLSGDSMNGNIGVVNGLVVVTISMVTWSYSIAALVPFVWLIPFLHRRNLRIFRWFGLGVRYGHEDAVTPALRSGVIASSRKAGITSKIERSVESDYVPPAVVLDSQASETIAELRRELDEARQTIVGLNVQHEVERDMLTAELEELRRATHVASAL